MRSSSGVIRTQKHWGPQLEAPAEPDDVRTRDSDLKDSDLKDSDIKDSDDAGLFRAAAVGPEPVPPGPGRDPCGGVQRTRNAAALSPGPASRSPSPAEKRGATRLPSRRAGPG